MTPDRSADGLPVAAVPGGAMLAGSLTCLAGAGYDTQPVLDHPRRQYFADQGLLTMRPSDVVTYVASGIAKLGIVGKDIIAEYSDDTSIYELCDLRFGACRMVLATRADDPDRVDQRVARFGRARIGTKFPRTARRWAQATGREVDIIELKGSVELAAVVGLADGIIDLVDTGRTLRENGLVEREDISTTSARLIVNAVHYAHNPDQVDHIAAALEAAAPGGTDG